MSESTRNILVLLAIMWAGSPWASAQLSFSGSDRKVIEQKAEASTGLNTIYVVADTHGVTASFTSPTGGTNAKWYAFSNLGGGYAREISASSDGASTSIELGSDDMGYIIEDGTTRYYCWVVNYANHRARFDSLTFSPEQECDRTRLLFGGEASRITYYTINGAGRVLDRDIQVDYYTLKYNSETNVFDQTAASQSLEYIDGTIGVVAPLCDTRFKLSGDRFLRAWGEEIEMESESYRAIAVEAVASATQATRESDNEQKIDATLGGSAPVDIRFEAAVTDAAIFREWQMSKDQTFEVVDDRIQRLDFDYTFRENGNTYVRFVANNAAGTCEYVGETFEVFVGESDLLCPNAFSPNDDGVNDEWRVSYKSIVDFDCHIFNRWGQEMIHLTNPAQGWDGKYNGRTVPTGVYYYVIKAKGSEGRNYHLSGDINIIKSSRTSGTTTAGE